MAATAERGGSEFRARAWLAPLAALSLAACVPDVAAVGSSVVTNVSTAGGLLATPSGAPRPVQLFVASTRQAEKGALAESIGPTKFAFNVVTVPPGHRAGVIEQPNWGAPDPRRHFNLQNRTSLERDEFFAQLAMNLSGRVGASRDVLLFVHGFNNSLNDARLRLTQIVADSDFGGVPVVFSWPSKRDFLSYGGDREIATASRDSLEAVIRGLANVPDVGRVHVLAHSMGTWLAMETLRQIAISGDPTLGGHLGEVMLAAPDLDLGVFQQQMARLPGARVSVFSTTNDRALGLSSTLSGRSRLGAVDLKDATVRQALEGMGVKVCDITDQASGVIRHGAFAETPQVVRSIGARLAEPRVGEATAQAIIGQRPEPIAARPAIEASALPPPEKASAQIPVPAL
ncbi:MAG: alpha/beta fold hydrolase [Rhodoblastus sp.]|nr:MAG: alpha/beta fold hydrolase [Rhodoblastus sp.]